LEEIIASGNPISPNLPQSLNFPQETNMLILTRADVEALLTMPAAIAAVEDGFRWLAAGEIVLPQRVATPVTPYEGLHLSMPVYVMGDPGALTVKIVTVFGQNPARYGLPAIQGVILLHDARTGQPLALIDAEHLTAMRTGAASGVATNYLARPDADVVTLFGAGAQAGPQLEAVCAVRPIRQVYVVTRSGLKDADFCARMEAKLGVPVTAAHGVDATRTAVERASIICTATNSTTPVFDGRWVQAGAHINAVGSYTAKMRELDLRIIRRSRVFVDHHPAAQTEAGDLLIPIANGELTYDHVAGALGQLLTGEVAGRRRPDEITVFKSVGLAMQDAVTVAKVYVEATEQGVGQRVEL
jgi:ornithine cyclodeaminase/alanine dehydrogenase-like protein (mu-crystallin family)